VLVPALVVGAALLLLGRPLSVLVSCLPFGMSWRTQAFLSWAGLRGAVPVVLATVPATVGTPGVSWLFDLVFVLVVIFTLVQAPALPWVARRLGIGSAHHRVDLNVETTPLDELGAELLEIDIGPGSRIAGVRVFELRLPLGANVALVVRDGASFVPRDNDVLRHGDQLLVVAPSTVRESTERRLHAVSRGGRLADWP
jgi:potassium/hydrogen antiporter